MNHKPPSGAGHLAVAGAAVPTVVWLPDKPTHPLTAGTITQLENGPYSTEVVEIARDLVRESKKD